MSRRTVMVMGMWALVWLLGASALAAALGFWYDLTHRSRPARLLTLTDAEHVRAKNMSNYYASVHGTEW
jgi:hypothetical protein